MNSINGHSSHDHHLGNPVPECILLELRMKHVVASAGAIKRAKPSQNRHRQQINIQFL